MTEIRERERRHLRLPAAVMSAIANPTGRAYRANRLGMRSSWAWLLVAALLALQLGNAHVDDGYCDTGDDEPGTSACSLYKASSRLFRCRDTQVLQMLFLSRVNDSVCDCCDGSDELPAARCPNTCSRLARDAAVARDEAKQRRQQGEVERQRIVKEASERLAAIRAGGAGAQGLLDGKREPLAQAKAALLAEERLEKDGRAQAVAQGAAAFQAYFTEFSKDQLVRIVATLTLLKKDAGVEAALVEVDDKFEEDGDDPDDSLAFQLVTDYEYLADDDLMGVAGEGGAEAEVGADGTAQATEGAAAAAAAAAAKRRLTVDHVDAMAGALSLRRLSAQGLIDVAAHAVARFAAPADDVNAAERTGPSAAAVAYAFEASEVSVSEAKRAAFPVSPAVLERQTFTRAEADALRQQVATLEGEMRQIQADLASSDEVKNVDFGEGDWLYTLWGRCYTWTQTSGDYYTYEVCPFKQAKQTATLLGTYERWGLQTANADAEHYVRDDGVVVEKERSKGQPYLLFSNGERCFSTGRPRTFVLHLECATTEEAISPVEEPETCYYTSVLKTPLACM